MKTMFKRTLSVFLSAMILFSVCIFASASAANGTCGENVTWSFDEITGTLTVSGTGDMNNYFTPEETPWHLLTDSVKSIKINNGVTGIGSCAFAWLENAETVTIPESVTKIGDHAFYDCQKLQNIDIPENITHIGNASFNDTGYYNDESNWVDGELYIENCLLYAVEGKTGIYNIKPGTKLIASFAFLYTIDITELVIPESVAYICKNAFFQCVNLNKITVDKNNARYLSDESGVLFNKEKTELILYPVKNPQTCCSVPSSIKVISSGAFLMAEKLTDISLPSELTTIEDWAFMYCYNLEKINIPAKTTHIGQGAFMGCEALKNFVIPYGITEIKDSTFLFCGMQSITIPDTVISIGNGALYFDQTVCDVYFSGTEDEWNSIELSKSGISIGEVIVHYGTVVIDYFFNENTQVIETPSSTTINYGDTLTLNCGIKNLPDAYRVVWGIEGDAAKITPTFDGLTCEVTSVGNGKVVIKAGVIDANGNPVKDNDGNYISASQELTSKMSVFDIIIDFFGKIFDFFFCLFK